MTLDVAITKRLGSGFRLDVSFRADRPRLGILGASGCGKSMTLKCIAGIETPDAGRIVLNGRTVFDADAGVNVPPQKRRVGYLFQNYALFPRMTVERNIGAGVPGSRERRRRVVAEYVRAFQLDGLEYRFPDQLSGGQQQRTALARMLAAEPEAILLDEPFSALDSHLRERMRVRLAEILRGRRDVVMVTHDRDEAYTLCDELVVLDEGRILGGGPTRGVFADPGQFRIARLTGCKNFSRMERVGANRIRALDWGVTLTTDRQVPDGTTVLGVRAHDLQPVRDAAPGMDNVVAVRVEERSEDPFEWTVIFTNADAGIPSERKRIWWKYSKYLVGEVPTHVRIPPEALLFLRDDGAGE